MQKEQINKILTAISQKQDKLLLSEFDFNTKMNNQLTLFLKPEVFFKNDENFITNSINMIEEKLSSFWVNINGIILLGWKVIEQYEIMDKHYWFINKMSKNASKIIDIDDRKKIEELLEIAPWTEYKLYWWHEYLSVSDKFDEITLDQFWFTKKSVKIRGWFYVQKYDIDWELIVFVNAFHPAQLKHFTDHSHYTLLMLVNSDTDWTILRNAMIWPTFPEKAEADSIRGTFYANKDKYGLDEVSIAYNCIHLSAWPFEGMFELNNFLNDLPDVNFDIENTNLWKIMLEKWLSKDSIKKSLLNPSVDINWKLTDLFGYTEDKNSNEAVDIFTNLFNN